MNRALLLVPLLLVVLAGLFFVLRPDPPAEELQEEEAVVGEPEILTDVVIEDGAMIPDEITVFEGDQAVLRIVSDSPVEFHVHGYNLTAEVEPDEPPAQLSFDAEITGRFEIENHATDPHEVLGALIVQPS